MPFAGDLDRAIFYHRPNPGTGAPLMMLTGMGGNLVSWPGRLVDGLCVEGFDVVLIEHRDSGLSFQCHEPYTLEDMASDVVGVIDALSLPSVNLLGCSLGGRVAQLVAIGHPGRVRSLVLAMTSAWQPPQPEPELIRPLLHWPGEIGTYDELVEHLAGFIESVNGRRGRQRAEFLEYAGTWLSRGLTAEGVRNQYQASAGTGDWNAALKGVHCPALVVHGREDALVPLAAARDLAHRLGNARLVEFDDMAHGWPRGETLDEVIREIHVFLDRPW